VAGGLIRRLGVRGLRPEFAAALGAVMMVFGAGLVGTAFAVGLLGGGRSAPSGRLSSWQPAGRGSDAAGEIASHVARSVAGSPAAVTPVAVRVGGSPVRSAPWLAAVVVHPRSGGLRVVRTRSVGYALCGTGAACSLPFDSLAFRRLARREALELALDSLAYLPVDGVVVVLPPRPGERPPQSALYFSRGDLAARLHAPLAQTLGAARPRVRELEGELGQGIDGATLPHLYRADRAVIGADQPALMLSPTDAA